MGKGSSQKIWGIKHRIISKGEEKTTTFVI
jgi:hypothetical protein